MQPLYTYNLSTLGGAVAAEVEGVLFGRDSHDRSINEAQLHDPSIVPAKAGCVMQPYP